MTYIQVRLLELSHAKLPVLILRLNKWQLLEKAGERAVVVTEADFHLRIVGGEGFSWCWRRCICCVEVCLNKKEIDFRISCDPKRRWLSICQLFCGCKIFWSVTLKPVRWLIHDGDIHPVFRSSLRVNLVTGAWWQNSFFHVKFDLRFIVLELSSDHFCLNQLPLIVFDKIPSSNSFGFCLRRIAASLCLSISSQRNFVIYSFSLRWHEAIEAALDCVEV